MSYCTCQVSSKLVTFISGGKVLLAFKQESPADHVENDEVLKALGLAESKGPEEEGATGGQVEGATGGQTEESKEQTKVLCEEDVCKKV